MAFVVLGGVFISALALMRDVLLAAAVPRLLYESLPIIVGLHVQGWIALKFGHIYQPFAGRTSAASMK